MHLLFWFFFLGLAQAWLMSNILWTCRFKQGSYSICGPLKVEGKWSAFFCLQCLWKVNESAEVFQSLWLFDFWLGIWLLSKRHPDTTVMVDWAFDFCRNVTRIQPSWLTGHLTSVEMSPWCNRHGWLGIWLLSKRHPDATVMVDWAFDFYRNVTLIQPSWLTGHLTSIETSPWYNCHGWLGIKTSSLSVLSNE